MASKNKPIGTFKMTGLGTPKVIRSKKNIFKGDINEQNEK